MTVVRKSSRTAGGAAATSPTRATERAVPTHRRSSRRPASAGRFLCSHIAVPALDGLADHRRGDLIRDLDVPQFAFALRDEAREQLRDHRDIADFMAAQAEAACDVFERGPTEHSEAIVDAVG